MAAADKARLPRRYHGRVTCQNRPWCLTPDSSSDAEALNMRRNVLPKTMLLISRGCAVPAMLQDQDSGLEALPRTAIAWHSVVRKLDLRVYAWLRNAPGRKS